MSCRAFVTLLLALIGYSVVWATLASAQADVEVRIKMVDRAGQTRVEVAASQLPELHRGCEATYDQLASASLLAARGGGRGANNLKPDTNATGPHSTWKTDADGNITGDAEWKPNPQNPSGFDQAKRVDTQHANPHTHHNKATGEAVPTPHVHEKSTPGGVRPARPDELPK